MNFSQQLASFLLLLPLVTSQFLPEIKKTYKLQNESETFADALQTCKSLGASLPRILNEAENTAVTSLRGNDAWLAFTRTDNTLSGVLPSSYTIDEDGFGGQQNVPPWQNNNPKENGDNCVILREDGTWIDGDCQATNDVVCEFKEEELFLAPIIGGGAAVFFLVLCAAFLVFEKRELKRIKIKEKASDMFYDKVTADDPDVLLKHNVPDI